MCMWPSCASPRDGPPIIRHPNSTRATPNRNMLIVILNLLEVGTLKPKAAVMPGYDIPIALGSNSFQFGAAESAGEVTNFEQLNGQMYTFWGQGPSCSVAAVLHATDHNGGDDGMLGVKIPVSGTCTVSRSGM